MSSDGGSTIDRFRKYAEDLRVLAESIKASEAKAAVLRVAADYERMARELEERSKPS